MEKIDSIAALEALYGTPASASTAKVADRLTPLYRRWIGRARFCILATVGPEGTDASPRGEDGPVVTEIDERTLLLPDWHGNNRVDSLSNIVRDGRVSQMFMVPGSSNVVRLNGIAVVTAADATLARFERDGKRPRSEIVVTVQEVYFQCARAILRSCLWSGIDESNDLPTPGQMIAEMTGGTGGGPAYDSAWEGRARDTLW